MTLKEYIDRLNKLAKDLPSALKLEVVYSSDDEGNNYNKVYYSPEVVNSDDMLDSYRLKEDTNYVCVN